MNYSQELMKILLLKCRFFSIIIFHYCNFQYHSTILSCNFDLQYHFPISYFIAVVLPYRQGMPCLHPNPKRFPHPNR